MQDFERRKEESFESMLRRFKRAVEHEGILREVRDRKHYEKPSARKRRKAKGRKK
jgi:small subunit ribosomal protein S21